MNESRLSRLRRFFFGLNEKETIEVYLMVKREEQKAKERLYKTIVKGPEINCDGSIKNN